VRDRERRLPDGLREEHRVVQPGLGTEEVVGTRPLRAYLERAAVCRGEVGEEDLGDGRPVHQVPGDRLLEKDIGLVFG
jgi:hypothetical protein